MDKQRLCGWMTHLFFCFCLFSSPSLSITRSLFHPSSVFLNLSQSFFPSYVHLPLQATRCSNTTGWNSPLRTRTTTTLRITARPSTTAPGGTATATPPTSTDSTCAASTPRTPTASSGRPGRVGSTRWNSQRWRSGRPRRRINERELQNSTRRTQKMAVCVRDTRCRNARTFWIRLLSHVSVSIRLSIPVFPPSCSVRANAQWAAVFLLIYCSHLWILLWWNIAGIVKKCTNEKNQ